MTVSTQEDLRPFEHSPIAEDDSCNCPIHRNRDHGPFTAPLGMEFADQVEVSSIPRSTATEIYEAHHGYMDGDLHPANFDHHGVYFQGNLMGALTYRYPFFSRKRMHFDRDGAPVAAPDALENANVPDEIRSRAKDLLGGVEESDVGRSDVLIGDQFVEVNRICLGERMANLASCSLAKSQEAFLDSSAAPDDFDYFLSYVRADYSASMIKALRDKGWTCVGISEPTQASNREQTEIQKEWKWCFACPVEFVEMQSTIADFGSKAAPA